MCMSRFFITVKHYIRCSNISSYNVQNKKKSLILYFFWDVKVNKNSPVDKKEAE